MAVNEFDIGKVERHLAAMVEKERREAIAYSVLTVLCTPAFVALAAFFVGVLVAYLFRHMWSDLNATLFYTGFNVFLASMLVFVLTRSSESYMEFEFHGMWVAGAIVFVLLLILTYGTSLRERVPVLFGVGYMVGGLLVLGLIGQVRLPDHTVGTDAESSFILAVPAFIVAAYGELLSASWLWLPPKSHEIRVGVRVLCRLMDDQADPLHISAVEDRVMTLLSKLKLARQTDQGLMITAKGLDLVKTAVRPGENRQWLGGASYD
jgi:hypothetical protein